MIDTYSISNATATASIAMDEEPTMESKKIKDLIRLETLKENKVLNQKVDNLTKLLEKSSMSPSSTSSPKNGYSDGSGHRPGKKQQTKRKMPPLSLKPSGHPKPKKGRHVKFNVQPQEGRDRKAVAAGNASKKGKQKTLSRKSPKHVIKKFTGKKHTSGTKHFSKQRTSNRC